MLQVHYDSHYKEIKYETERSYVVKHEEIKYKTPQFMVRKHYNAFVNPKKDDQHNDAFVNPKKHHLKTKTNHSFVGPEKLDIVISRAYKKHKKIIHNHLRHVLLRVYRPPKLIVNLANINQWFIAPKRNRLDQLSFRLQLPESWFALDQSKCEEAQYFAKGFTSFRSHLQHCLQPDQFVWMQRVNRLILKEMLESVDDCTAMHDLMWPISQYCERMRRLQRIRRLNRGSKKPFARERYLDLEQEGHELVAFGTAPAPIVPLTVNTGEITVNEITVNEDEETDLETEEQKTHEEFAEQFFGAERYDDYRRKPLSVTNSLGSIMYPYDCDFICARFQSCMMVRQRDKDTVLIIPCKAPPPQKYVKTNCEHKQTTNKTYYKHRCNKHISPEWHDWFERPLQTSHWKITKSMEFIGGNQSVSLCSKTNDWVIGIDEGLPKEDYITALHWQKNKYYRDPCFTNFVFRIDDCTKNTTITTRDSFFYYHQNLFKRWAIQYFSVLQEALLRWRVPNPYPWIGSRMIRRKKYVLKEMQFLSQCIEDHYTKYIQKPGMRPFRRDLELFHQVQCMDMIRTATVSFLKDTYQSSVIVDNWGSRKRTICHNKKENIWTLYQTVQDREEMMIVQFGQGPSSAKYSRLNNVSESNKQNASLPASRTTLHNNGKKVFDSKNNNNNNEKQETKGATKEEPKKAVQMKGTIGYKLAVYTPTVDQLEIDDFAVAFPHLIHQPSFVKSVINIVGDYLLGDFPFVESKTNPNSNKPKWCIVKLLVPTDAKITTPTDHGALMLTPSKLRCNKAFVLDLEEPIYDVYEIPLENRRIDTAWSAFHTRPLQYKVGTTVDDSRYYDDNQNEECAGGIHFHLRREDAFFWINQTSAITPQIKKHPPSVLMQEKKSNLLSVLLNGQQTQDLKPKPKPNSAAAAAVGCSYQP